MATIREQCSECDGGGERGVDLDGYKVAGATFRCDPCNGTGYVEYSPEDEQADIDNQAAKEGDWHAPTSVTP